MRRRNLLTAFAVVCVALASPFAIAQAPEKPKLSIGVGGKSLFYYLPPTIAERQGYFKAEGLDIEVLDFPGGAKALQALLGGSVDVVSGAYEHTISQQAKGQNIEALILQAEGVFDINTVFAGIVVLTACALVLDVIVTKAEARLLVWRPKAAETEAL